MAKSSKKSRRRRGVRRPRPVKRPRAARVNRPTRRTKNRKTIRRVKRVAKKLAPTALVAPVVVSVPVAAKPVAKPAPKVPESAVSWIYNQISSYWKSTTKAKKKNGGSIGAAKADYKAASGEVARLQGELKDEAKRGGRGKRYDKLVADLKLARSDQRSAGKRVSDAESSASSGQVTGAVAQVGALVAGTVIGERMATGADKRFAASIEKNKAQVTKVAKEARTLMNKVEKGGKVDVTRAKLRAINKEGNLLLNRGPVGGGKIAGLLLATVATRYAAAGVEDPTAKAALNAAATFEGALAVGILGKSLLYRNNPTASVPVQDRAAITAAGDIGKQKGPVRKRRAPAKKKAASIAGKLKPVALNATAANAALKRISAIASKASTGGLRALMPIVFASTAGYAFFGQGATPAAAAEQGLDAATGGSASRYKQLRSKGYSKATSTAGAVDKFLGAPVQGTARLVDEIGKASTRVRKPRGRLKKVSSTDLRINSQAFASDIVSKFNGQRRSRGYIDNAARQVAASRPKPAPAAAGRPTTGKKGSNTKRGTQNLKNLKSILKSKKFGRSK